MIVSQGTKKALDKMFRGYDLLISQTQDNVKKWVTYGESTACFLCWEYSGECTKCPLWEMTGPTNSPCMTDSFFSLLKALHMYFYGSNKDVNEITLLAKARRKNLLKALKDRDIDTSDWE